LPHRRDGYGSVVRRRRATNLIDGGKRRSRCGARNSPP
jgi:hypothetical protein